MPYRELLRVQLGASREIELFVLEWCLGGLTYGILGMPEGQLHFFSLKDAIEYLPLDTCYVLDKLTKGIGKCQNAR